MIRNLDRWQDQAETRMMAALGRGDEAEAKYEEGHADAFKVVAIMLRSRLAQVISDADG